MIGFKQFLTEARMAPLYHGTDFTSAINILATNRLQSNTQEVINGKSTRGVSLSRSPKISARFGRYILELDQSKIAYKNRIIPHQWFNSQNSITQKMVAARSRREATSKGFVISNNMTEFEEFVIGDIENIRKIITAIYIRAYNSIIDDGIFKQMAENYGIPVKSIDARMKNRFK